MSSIVVRGCSWLLLSMVLVPSVRAGADDESWASKKIILTRDGIRIGQGDGKGVVLYTADLSEIVYRVIREQDGWLLVRERGVEGWLSKDSAVLLKNAVPYFSDRLRANNRDALAYAHRGCAWREKGEMDFALKDFDEAIRLASETDERFVPVRPIVGRIFGGGPQMQMQVPQHPSWFRQRGLLYDEKGEYDKAIRDFSEAIHLNPQDPHSYVERGITFKRKKEFDKAIADHSEAIRLDSKWANAYFNRANVYKARKDYDCAISDFSEAIRLDPQDPDAFFNRANIYKAWKDYDRAISDFSEAIRLDPQDPDAFFNRDNIYRGKKDYVKAAADLCEVIRLDPKDPDAHEALAWLLATCPDSKVRDGEKAVQCAGTACELTDGKSAYCLATLAAAFAEVGKFDLAVKWQQRALESTKYDKDEGSQARLRLQLFHDRKPYRED